MAIAFVGKWGNDRFGSGTTIVTSGAKTVTAGNLIVVGWSYDTNGAPVSVADVPAANTFVIAGAVSTNVDSVRQLYAKNCNAGTNDDITITGPAGFHFPSMTAAEYSGLDTTDPLDKTANNTGTSATLTSGSTGTLSQADELVVVTGQLSAGTANSFTAGAGMSEVITSGRADVSTTSGQCHKIVASTAATTGSLVSGWGSSTYSINIATYKGAAAAGDTLFAQSVM